MSDRRDLIKTGSKVAFAGAAGGGIARSTGLCRAEEGAGVVVNSYSEDVTTRTPNAVDVVGRRVLAMSCEITKANTITHVVQQTLDTFDTIDISCKQGRYWHKNVKMGLNPDLLQDE